MPFILYEPYNNGKQCNSKEHNPPTMIKLNSGKHIYKCPACGKETVVYVPEVK